MLTVNVDKIRSDSFQNADGGRSAVDTTFSFGVERNFSLNDKSAVIGIKTVFMESFKGFLRNILKFRTDKGRFRAVSYQVTGSSVSQNGIDGVYDNRLACTRFACKNVKTV